VNFQFVRAQPPSESEKVRNRAIVRGHASRYSWRKLRDPPASSRLGRARESRLQLPEKTTHDLELAVSARSSEDSSDQPTDFEGTGIDNGIAHPNVHPSSCQLSPAITKSRPYRSASWSIQSNVLRNDGVDPFETYPSELSSGVIGPILAQSKCSSFTIFMTGWPRNLSVHQVVCIFLVLFLLHLVAAYTLVCDDFHCVIMLLLYVNEHSV